MSTARKTAPPISKAVICLVVIVLQRNVIAQNSGIRASTTENAWRKTEYGLDLSDSDAPADDELRTRIAVKWEPPVLDALGNYCFIKGQLLERTPDRSQLRPFRWRRGITVYLAKAPHKKLDWSNGMRLQDSTYRTTITEKNGTFEFCIDLRKITKSRKHSEPFQMAIALAKHIKDRNERLSITWRSDQPALSTTIIDAALPAAPALPLEFELINAARDWPRDTDPTPLIRAVNALQSCGKTRAIEILQRYHELETDKYSWEGSIIFWIVRTLFEPIELSDRMPHPGIVTHIPVPESHMQNWPHAPIAIIDDIPFMVGESAGGATGIPEDSISHVKWAESYGVIRSQPLNPTGNPMLAGEKLMGSLQFQMIPTEWDDPRNRIQCQAVAALHTELGTDKPSIHDSISEQDWQKYLKRADQLKIRWNQESQSFTREVDE